jgi:plasmid stabilization system protein ParE
MRVRWTTDAADDLERICDYIAETSPGAAQKIAATIVQRIVDLETFPQLGRQGRWKERSCPSHRCRLSPFTKSTRGSRMSSEFSMALGDGRRARRRTTQAQVQ